VVRTRLPVSKAPSALRFLGADLSQGWEALQTWIVELMRTKDCLISELSEISTLMIEGSVGLVEFFVWQDSLSQQLDKTKSSANKKAGMLCFGFMEMELMGECASQDWRG